MTGFATKSLIEEAIVSIDAALRLYSEGLRTTPDHQLTVILMANSAHIAGERTLLRGDG
jgi:hypothetical protein